MFLDDFHLGTARYGRKSICKQCISSNYKNKKWKLISKYKKVSYLPIKCKYCGSMFNKTRKDKQFCTRICCDKHSRLLRRDKHKQYFIDKYHNDIQRKLSSCLRSRLNRALKNNSKRGSAVRDLGCTIEELKKHLESKFKPGMSWDNWTRNGWHIDHVKPLSKFDLNDREQLKKACHYSNLQPLWAKDNLSKGIK